MTGIDVHGLRDAKSVKAHSAKDDVMAELPYGENAFDDPTGTKCMSEVGLKAIGGCLAEFGEGKRFAFHFVVVEGGSAMCRDEGKVLWRGVCFVHCLLNGVVESIACARGS